VIDTLKEKLFRLNEARFFFPRRRKNKHPALETMYRWTGRGCRGVVLESVSVGRCRCTSLQAIQRFVERLSALDTSGPQVRSPTARERASRSAGEELGRIGI
jgi:hypothetical protein